jgi:alpha-glucosidase
MTEPHGGDWLWWKHGVIYQIYPRSFGDSNGDGIGDLDGISHHLDYLSNVLGVEAIWLSPFFPSPMADFGYDVSDYCDVDPMFGDLQAFDRLLRASHDRDIRVIIDFVPNHSSDRHAWFQESRSSRDNPKRDWYYWRDPKPDGSPPNNWQAHFGGGAWEWDEATGQYYLHSFLKEQPDLNWRNPELREAMFDAIRFWLDRGVDGFRIDVANAIMKDPELRDNPPNPSYDPAIHRPFDSILHTMSHSHPDVHEVYQDLRRLLDEYSTERPRMMVGEIHIFDYPLWATYYGPTLNEFHLPFNFGLSRLEELRVPAVRQVVDAVEDALRESGGWPNYVLGNHDVHRVASRFGAEKAAVAMMLLLTLRGTPTMYYGEEIGMHDVPIPPDRIQDPFEILTPGRGLGRDPERTPMQWDNGPNAGFSPPGLEPWLPIPDDAGGLNVAVETEDPRSMLSLTRALLRLRRDEAALHAGSYRPVDTGGDDCYVYVRESRDRRFLVALNFTGEPRTLATPFEHGELLLSTHMDRSRPQKMDEFELRPNEGWLVSLTSSP